MGLFSAEKSGYDYWVDLETNVSQWTCPVLLRDADFQYYGLEEPDPAGPAGTTTAMREGWLAVLPRSSNPANARPQRIDIYASIEAPQRCLFVNQSNLVAFCGDESDATEWKYALSFFAYTKSMPGSTRYSVWSACRPFRCKVCMEQTETDGDSTAERHRGWQRRFEFHAFYSPLQGAIRLNVQQVPNPLRHRISEMASARGGWDQLFSFFAYPTIRQAVYEAVYCEPALERSMIKAMPVQDSPFLHPPIDQIEYDPEGDPELTTSWCRKFEFIGFKSRYPGTVQFTVLQRFEPLLQDENMSKEEKKYAEDVHFPIFKLAQEGQGDIAGWTPVTEFFAFPLPIPGTTRFYFKVARKPTRFRVTLHDHIGPWLTLFSFYAYSTRAQDVYRIEY
ncbi:Hypothetical Protein FCC1311_090012 [Hondaea fermentalgiana]|uniref:Uncharacterized protein n=1 Tax=Hondaea fermentalgiana TaxID=2315210 RepID=A0A2R5GPH1_9STRA|nr:Hypothetical Protein FCC1311_090012 [Hondaea fermentalgiana]|eukprot:GBG32776.1 Hypothetical Protein FCC1311_090012 [Hondaea fermentalgiana]